YLTIPGMISLGGGNPHPSTFPITVLTFKMRDGDNVEIVETDNEPLQTLEHKPPNGGLDIDLLMKTFDMLLTEESTLLIEAPAYVGSLAYLGPLGCKFAEVDVDGEDLYRKWEDASIKPKVLYTVPTGGRRNPAGASTTYYLMDVDGRVLRFDSFSKILSAGVRLGWVTGPPNVERIVLHAQSTLLHTSGMSQMIVYHVLKKWGIEGFLAHTDTAANKYLNGLAEWTEPNRQQLLGVDDSSVSIVKAADHKVLMVPGFEFHPNPRKTAYVRASFSTATAQEFDVALGRLARVVRGEEE
ncbi:pyridoxal phosphate-dependent transferase, partial [Chytridium lagenaria]